MNFRTTISALGARLRSPRTLLAIVVSCVATAGVGGPLAYEAYHARDLIAAQRAGAETTERRHRSNEISGCDRPPASRPHRRAPTSTSTTAPAPTSIGTIGTPTTAARGGGGSSGSRGSGVTAPPPSVPPTTVPAGQLTILVSVSAQHVPFAELAGNQVTGIVYAFVADARQRDRAVATRRRCRPAPRRASRRPELSIGAHSLQAIATTAGSAPPPEPPPSPSPAETP